MKAVLSLSACLGSCSRLLAGELQTLPQIEADHESREDSHIWMKGERASLLHSWGEGVFEVGVGGCGLMSFTQKLAQSCISGKGRVFRCVFSWSASWGEGWGCCCDQPLLLSC